MLMSPKGSERIAMPAILVSLQRSVISVMLAKTEHPDFMNNGILKSSKLDEFFIPFKNTPPRIVYSISSDGTFIYMYSSQVKAVNSKVK